MYIHRNYYTICVMSFCNHCKNQISSSALYLRFLMQFSSSRTFKITKSQKIIFLFVNCLLFLTCTILFDLNFACIWYDILFFRNSVIYVILDQLNDTLFLQNNLLIFLFSFSFRWWHFCKCFATTGHHSTTTSQR